WVARKIFFEDLVVESRNNRPVRRGSPCWCGHTAPAIHMTILCDEIILSFYPCLIVFGLRFVTLAENDNRKDDENDRYKTRRDKPRVEEIFAEFLAYDESEHSVHKRLPCIISCECNHCECEKS